MSAANREVESGTGVALRVVHRLLAGLTLPWGMAARARASRSAQSPPDALMAALWAGTAGG